LPTHTRSNAEFWLEITSRSAFGSGTSAKGQTNSEYVAERDKESLWNDIMAYFNLLECEDEDAARQLRAKVKQWTLKKMAELFQVWKKKLWKNYLKTKKVPVFEGYLAKQANHWKAF
jgi:hypothetical protein